MGGGDRCPPLVEVTACPEVPTCVYDQRQAVRTTAKLHGVASKVYSSNKGSVQLALKAAYSAGISKALSGDVKFQLRFRTHDLASTPTEGSARRRRDVDALAPAATDTEL